MRVDLYKFVLTGKSEHNIGVPWPSLTVIVLFCCLCKVQWLVFIYFVDSSTWMHLEKRLACVLWAHTTELLAFLKCYVSLFSIITRRVPV